MYKYTFCMQIKKLLQKSYKMDEFFRDRPKWCKKKQFKTNVAWNGKNSKCNADNRLVITIKTYFKPNVE